jgi:hypothetical protein
MVMKKIFLTLVALTTITFALKAQPFAQGDHVINVGIGFGHLYYASWGGAYHGNLPVMGASYEYGIVEVPMGSDLTGVVSVGGIFTYTGGKYDYLDDDYYVWTSVLFAARGNYHFIFHDKLDTYAGVLLGFSTWSQKWKGDGDDPDWDDTNAGFEGGAYVGARWYFNDWFAVWSEIGYLPAVFNVGAAFKL